MTARQQRQPRQHERQKQHRNASIFLILFVVVLFGPCHAAFTSSSSTTTPVRTISYSSSTSSSTVRFMVSNNNSNKRLTPREEEIQRKILQLKRQGRVPPSQPTSDSNDDASSSTKTTSPNVWSPPRTKTDYTQKLQNKLGVRKSRFLGLETLDEENNDNDEDEVDDDVDLENTPTLGSLALTEEVDEILTPLKTTSTSSSSSSTNTVSKKKKQYNINPDLFDDDEANQEPSEQDLVELVEKKLLEKRRREMEWEQKQQQQQEQQQRRLQEQEQQQPVGVGSSSSSTTGSRSSSSSSPSSTSTNDNESNNFITTGVGGNWNQNASVSAKDDLYVPSSSGSWGAFPRPRDISKAYGGGRQVKPGSTASATSNEDATRERLRQYRERVGIEVQSEKDHASEIDEALQIASYAMQRGVYATAVSALEKVTKHCSTNSKVGSKVFLELAMAYEAVGRSGEAMTVYRTLSSCRMEDIKFNAKRLLYGMEAMQFMRDEAKSADFSRKKIRNTFIDTTGLANIAQQFDDVYQTAYIDLNSNFYRRLTESVVRSNREARQILLKATGSGEVDRLKIVQALRSLSRNFEAELEKEIRVSQPKPEPVALMNGKPIVPDRLLSDDDDDNKDNNRDLNNMMNSVDEFTLSTAEQMMENLQGEWRLQLIADRRGDGVKYFNSSLSWQSVDTNAMTFQSSGSVGFLTMSQSGEIEFDMTRRVLKRNQVRSSGGGGMLTSFLWANPKDGGVVGAICSPQQIMSVDSILLITQCAASAARKKDNADKDHYAVWRRVEAGTYSRNTRD